MLEWFESPEGKWFKKEIAEDNAPDADMRKESTVVQSAVCTRWLPTWRATMPTSSLARILLRAYLRKSAGLERYLEMQQLQRAGLSLEQIFRAATINNAREFKLDSQLATIDRGKIANLVLLKKSR